MLKETNKRILSMAMAFVMAGSCVFGALAEPTDSQAAKKPKLKTKSVSLNVGKKKTIQITGKRKKAKYTFKASNKKIKVSKKGVITAVKKGTAKVKVSETYKKKKKTIGTVKVTVKTKAVPKKTVTPQVSATPVVSASATPAASPSAPAVQSEAPTVEPTPVVRPTIEPAYETKTLDFEGSTSKVVESELTVPMEKAMIYGGLCTVSAEFTQETGSAQDISVGYDGTYLSFKKNGAYIDKNSFKDEAISDAQTFSCPSGEKTKQEFTFEVPKYSKDFNLKISGAGKFTVENVTVKTQPFASADYASMVANSTASTGNNARIKKAIAKAEAGEDVTIAYLGGSITEGFAASETDNSDCYAETSYKQFKKIFGAGDGSNVHFINAGMSGTPSSLGIVRYQRDVLDQMKTGEYPDILFIDFAVNDGNDADTYESVIRTALEQGSAVVLMFVLYTGGCAHEKEYTQYGKYYDLAMVSPAQGMASCKKEEFDKWFYWIEGNTDTSYGHPDVGGHRYMADCITNMFLTIDQEEEEEDNITDVNEIDPKTSDKFQGMKTLLSSTDLSQSPSVKSVDPGSFSMLTDSAQSTLQYIKDGKENMQWFPDVWMHTSSTGSDSFKATINCRSLIVAYKMPSGTSGKADCYIDGKRVGTMGGSGWNNAGLLRALQEDEVKEHELEIRMQDGDEKKPFTIFAIGYCD
ncbi:MAG: hypothetical protein HFG34_06340 [Eubacterium sp.]|nr:hypothetical protein [Eubacterium sp.]